VARGKEMEMVLVFVNPTEKLMIRKRTDTGEHFTQEDGF
jgi:hypothetical protein